MMPSVIIINTNPQWQNTSHHLLGMTIVDDNIVYFFAVNSSIFEVFMNLCDMAKCQSNCKTEMSLSTKGNGRFKGISSLFKICFQL